MDALHMVNRCNTYSLSPQLPIKAGVLHIDCLCNAHVLYVLRLLCKWHPRNEKNEPLRISADMYHEQ